MIGLIKKDLFTLKKQILIVVFFAIFYGALSFAEPNNYGMFAYMITLFSIFIPMTSLSYDERSEWNKYAITMPISRKHIVYSKYLLCVLAISASAILCILLSFLLEKKLTIESIATISTSLSIGVLFMSINIPFNFKFGVEKSRFLIFGLVGIPTVLIVLLNKLEIQLPSEDTIIRLLKLLPLISVGCLILSILASLLSQVVFPLKSRNS